MLGKNRLAVSSIEVHSTFETHNGKKKTHYYTPFEDEFFELVNANIQKKWRAFHKKESPGEVKIKPLFSGNRNDRTRFFGVGPNRTVIKGWNGRFRIEGDADLLRFAVDAGLGSRNSQGFGMVEVAG